MSLTKAECAKRYLEGQSWIDGQQRRTDLSLPARLIAGRIGFHKNLETGQCNPGAGTLAKEAGVSERTAFRAIAALERKGCIRVTRTRDGAPNNANRYVLIPAPTGDTVSGVDAAVRGDKRGRAPLTGCQANYKRNYREGERNAFPLP